MKYFNAYITIILILGFNTHSIQTKQSQAAACIEYAAMKSGEAGLELSAKTLFLFGEIAEKGINIRKFHFSGSIAGIEEGILPKVEIEGIVLGQSFHITINVTDDDLKAPTQLVTKIVKAITEKEESSKETQLVLTTNEIKE